MSRIGIVVVGCIGFVLFIVFGAPRHRKCTATPVKSGCQIGITAWDLCRSGFDDGRRDGYVMRS
jgi:hypothetical protein